MRESFIHLGNDALFRERSAALSARAPKDRVRPLDEIIEPMQRFTAVRRREVRLALLENADRPITDDLRFSPERVPDAIKGFSEALKMLTEQAAVLRPLISAGLDDVIALVADDQHPLRKVLHEMALSLGFSSEEAEWLFSELKGINYRPVELVCAGGFDDLMTMLSSISAGEAGLLIAGFVRFTGDAQTDERLQKLIIRLRQSGVTASIFLALAIIIVAHTVAVQHASQSTIRSTA